MADLDPGDEPPFPAMSPAGVEELTEGQQDQQGALKQQAADALEDGQLELALQKLTEAVALGCASALLYSRRAQVLMKLERPRATINDCTAALAINHDSGKAYKIRARAHAKLEHWEAAHADFQTGLKIDYDEQTDEDSRSVAEKVKELHAQATAKRVKEEEAENQKKLQASREAYEAAVKARAQASVQGMILNTEADYQKAIGSSTPVVILFTAAW